MPSSKKSATGWLPAFPAQSGPVGTTETLGVAPLATTALPMSQSHAGEWIDLQHRTDRG